MKYKYLMIGLFFFSISLPLYAAQNWELVGETTKEKVYIDNKKISTKGSLKQGVIKIIISDVMQEKLGIKEGNSDILIDCKNHRMKVVTYKLTFLSGEEEIHPPEKEWIPIDLKDDSLETKIHNKICHQ